MAITVGRAIFVSVPFLLTLIALVGVSLVFSGNVSPNTIAQRFPWLSITSAAPDGTNTTQTIGMWNSCLRTSVSTTCNATRAAYFFDPMAELNLTSEYLALLDIQWPAAFVDAMDIFESMTKWAFYIYAIGIALAALTVPISFFAFSSRAGSLLAVLVNFLTGTALLAGSTLYTIVFASLYNFIKRALAETNTGNAVSANLNKNTFVATWLAVLAITIAFWFWSITCCCCKGRTRRSDSYKLVDRQTPVFGAHPVLGYNQEYGVHKPGSVSSTRYEPYRT